MPQPAATGFDVLRYRAARLDRSVPDEIYATPEEGIDPDAAWFAEVLAGHSAMSATTDDRGQPLLSGIEPDQADAIIAECALIGRLRASAPRVVDGPVDLSAQQWVHHRPAHLPQRGDVPSARHFVPVDAETTQVATTKPWEAGFFTSTAAWDGWSMWRIYQEVHSFTCPAPLPRWQMHVEPGAAVHEIRSATDWVRFVERYPMVVQDRAYPDWPAVAREWDAVHFTAFAIAAAQGLVFAMVTAQVQPLQLDVEQTFWLSWRFSGASLERETDVRKEESPTPSLTEMSDYSEKLATRMAAHLHGSPQTSSKRIPGELPRP